MPTGYTSLLGLALPVTGDLSGTWGDTVNNSLTQLVDSAVAGTTTLSTDADVSLTTTPLASNTSRQAILLCTGNRTSVKTITAPAQSKVYIIINATTASIGGPYGVKIVGVGPTTGITINNGKYAVVAWNGSDFVQVAGNDLTALTGILPVANGGTGVTTSTGSGANVLGTSPTLTTPVIASIVNTGTLTLPTSTDTLVGRATTDTLTNKTITPRVVSIADGTSVTINADTTDIATQTNTQAVGTLTINAPTGTPFNGQKIMFRLQSTNVQTFSWNGIFAGSADLILPTASSGSSKYDYVGFIYNSTAAKWQLLAKVFGF